MPSRRDFLKVSSMAGVGVVSNIFTWNQATIAMKQMDKDWSEDAESALHMVTTKYFDLYKEKPNAVMVAHVDTTVRGSVLSRIGIADRVKALDLELDVVSLRDTQLLYGFIKQHEVKNANDDNRHWLVAKLISDADWSAGCRGVEHTALLPKQGLRHYNTHGWVHNTAMTADIPPHLEV